MSEVEQFSYHRTKYQESVNGNVAEICETVAVNTRFRCRFGDVYSCFRCCGHSGTVPLFYMFPSGFS